MLSVYGLIDSLTKRSDLVWIKAKNSFKKRYAVRCLQAAINKTVYYLSVYYRSEIYKSDNAERNMKSGEGCSKVHN